MYESFYRLNEKPFRIVPNPGLLYLSEKHQTALTYLEYGITEDVGVILLTGDVGAGKTTLVRHLMNTLCREMPTSVIFNTNLAPDELLSLVLKGFGVACQSDSKADKLDALYRYLVDRFAEGKNPLLIIDEAQNLSMEVLEEVRMLSNLQSDEKLLLQIMLVGQPDLKTTLLSPSLVQFAQRIAVNYHLSSFNREETQAYIKFRVRKAGRTAPLFTAEAIEKVFEASGGVPRIINLICDFALVYAFGEGYDPVGKRVVEKVIAENFSTTPLADDAAPPDPVPESRPSDDAIDARIRQLEMSVEKLQLQTDWYVRKLEDNTAMVTDAIVGNLSKHLSDEKRRHSKIIRKYNELVKKYKTLQQKMKN